MIGQGGPYNTSNISNLFSGFYSVIVSDSNSCTFSETYFVDQNDEIIYSPLIEDVTCYGDSSGNAYINIISGGVSPFDIYWDNGNIGDSLNNVSLGIYHFTINDNFRLFS